MHYYDSRGRRVELEDNDKPEWTPTKVVPWWVWVAVGFLVWTVALCWGTR